MIDTLMRNLVKLDKGEYAPSQRIKDFCGRERRYGVITLHRPSNVDSREIFTKIWDAISAVSRKVPLLFPVHPRTRAKLESFGIDCTGIDIVDPVGYLEMLYAVRGATLVLTDSGGVQEETTVLGIPCVTIRENTERPVTVEIGTNYLVGTNPESIVVVANNILIGKAKKGTIPPLWDGKASERIVKAILQYNY
jgi:UDP-N-acetylglucosamine 2-epimerase (non-hydrolysing)